MKELYHECVNALAGMKQHIRAHRRATDELIADKEWQIILCKMKRTEDALKTYRENREDG